MPRNGNKPQGSVPGRNGVASREQTATEQQGLFLPLVCAGKPSLTAHHDFYDSLNFSLSRIYANDDKSEL